MNKRFLWLIPILCLSLTLGGCSNFNLFSWTHKRGGDSSVPALMADAEAALADDDYQEAIDLYEEILDKDSDNAEALYGLAEALMGEAGFSIADIIANLLEGEEGEFDEEDFIPENIDLGDLEEATEEIIDLLQQIVDGEADGSIPSDSVDVLINLALAEVLHAAALIMDTNGNGENDEGDVIVITTDYEITLDTDNITAENKEDILEDLETAKQNIIDAVENLENAIDELGIEDEDSSLGDLDEDFDELLEQIDDAIDKIELYNPA